MTELTRRKKNDVTTASNEKDEKGTKENEEEENEESDSITGRWRSTTFSPLATLMRADFVENLPSWAAAAADAPINATANHLYLYINLT